jgi:hypothetical protein
LSDGKLFILVFGAAARRGEAFVLDFPGVLAFFEGVFPPSVLLERDRTGTKANGAILMICAA